ncbi:hypothetical protein HN789_00660 [archaeon]|jgi:hypothetical protein|nr:hypothetical protein [archaeon]MBT4022039.1 hypothetical protein [archaeon]MBT4272652.1 hypothetical protein [archaeon]MBT4461450.1 hypothetical protein [archaeon]MBT4857780.1 hypothetical protein [archaeon]
MNRSIIKLKARIFGFDFVDKPILSNSNENQILEEILESLSLKKYQENFVIFNPLEKIIESKKEFDNQEILINDNKISSKAKILLYEFEQGMYYVYTKKESNINPYLDLNPKIHNPKSEFEMPFGLFVPSGVIIRRVSQNILGTGVLGRAFLGMNYIEILDSLFGNAYQEVLTHEVMHIMYPQKKEMEIRHITRNYVGPKNTIYH